MFYVSRHFRTRGKYGVFGGTATRVRESQGDRPADNDVPLKTWCDLRVDEDT